MKAAILLCLAFALAALRPVAEGAWPPEAIKVIDEAGNTDDEEPGCRLQTSTPGPHTPCGVIANPPR